MDYEKKYKEALEWVRKVIQGKVGFVLDEVLEKFPELKESEDATMVKFIKNQLFNIKKTITDNYELDAKLTKAIDWLEKQGNSHIKWNKNTKDRKPKVNHSVLMKTTQGIAEGEWQGEQWYQYRWAGIIRDTDVLSWIELSNLEKQGEQKPTEEYNITGIKSKHAEGKLGEMIKNLKPVNEVLEQKPADNQFTPEQAGILDKHIDKFLEQNPWSEEDEKILNYLLWFYDTRFRWNDTCHDDIKFGDIVTFLKSLKDRVQPQPKQEWNEEEIENCAREAEDNSCIILAKHIRQLKSLRPQSQWKPSEEMLEALYRAIPQNTMAISEDEMLLDKLYQGLKYGRVFSKN